MRKFIQIIVDKVEVRQSLRGIYNRKPSKFENTYKSIDGICLYVQGVDKNGNPVHFFTPQAIINKWEGAVVYYELDKNDGNFFIQKEEKVIPLISFNDTITISYEESEIKYNSLFLKVTELIPTY